MTEPSKDVLAALRELIERARSDPALLERMSSMLRAAMASRPAAEGEADEVWHGMVGRSPRIVALRKTMEKFASVPSTVLIRGESGTGKDLVARILHELGPRRDQTMISENCAAIPETLLESVLFGHVRGAFTGAVRDHPGHFVAAHRGTLFLDEIGDMSLAMQAKLLRVLQEGEVRPVGGEKVRRVDVRVLAATNQDLARLVETRQFREDLFYRLNVLQIDLPPLRERGDDVVLLARRLLASGVRAAGRELVLSAGAEARIAAYQWPGNIRQLQNEMQRVVALAEGPEVQVEDLSPEVCARD